MLLSLSRQIAAIAALLVSAPAAALGSSPTPAQMRTSVSRAERSSELWATINICNTPAHPNQLGVRAQIPALGFPASLSIAIEVKYFASGSFRPDPGVKKLIRLGTQSNRVHQAGHTFQFAPHAGLLTGAVTFAWKRGGQLLGQITRPTTGGHRDVDFGDPRKHSAATCRIS
jgi:hypothetical protein